MKDEYLQVRAAIDVIETTSKLIGYQTFRTKDYLEILKNSNNKVIIIALNKDRYQNPILLIKGLRYGDLYFEKNDFTRQMKYLKALLNKL